MAIKKVLRYGEPSLREKSKEVHKVSRKISDLIRDLLDTMYAQNGVGLAAPQIGENVRVFVFFNDFWIDKYHRVERFIIS